MDGIIRRRGMVEAVGGSPYPYISDFPEFTEYGVYKLQYVSSTTTSSTNLFISSASTNYQWAGGGGATRTLQVSIINGSGNIVVDYFDNNQQRFVSWTTKTFVGFPVKIKRCAGSASNPPLVTFEVTKEA